MDAARLAGFYILINVTEEGFVWMEVIEVIRPKTIIHGNANKVKSKFSQKVQCLLIGWLWSLIGIPGTHPLEIKTIILPVTHQQAGYRVCFSVDGEMRDFASATVSPIVAGKLDFP